MSAPRLQIKRVYEPVEENDGRRVLVERLWPRGMKKEALAADAWEKDVAPSAELRKWFAHDPERWAEFQRRYAKELDENTDAWRKLLADAHGDRTLTLLYSAHDDQNSASVLRDYLKRRAR